MLKLPKTRENSFRFFVILFHIKIELNFTKVVKSKFDDELIYVSTLTQDKIIHTVSHNTKKKTHANNTKSRVNKFKINSIRF